MLKAIWCAHRGPDLSFAEYSQHWFEVHGPLHVQDGHKLRGYIQHHSLISACDDRVSSTHDGASIVWLDNLDAYRDAFATKAFRDAIEDGNSGVRGHLALLSDPLAFAIGHEHVVVDGKIDRFMVKLISVVRRHHSLSRDEFLTRWSASHRKWIPTLPLVRRHVQVHGLGEGLDADDQTYDGWSETWFDTLDDLRITCEAEAWKVLDGSAGDGSEDPALFADDRCVVIGRERHILDRQASIGRQS